MFLDIKTLMILYVIINFVSATAVGIAWVQNRGRFKGISFWFVDMLLQATGSVLIVLRGLIPDFISIVVSNTMILAGAILILMGLQLFVNIKGTQIHNYILLAVYLFCSSYFSLVQPDLAVREIILSLTIMLITFQSAWLLLLRVPSHIREITIFTGIVFLCYAIFSLIRIILYSFFPVTSNDFFKAGIVDSIAITIYIILTVSLAISLALMVNRRLLREILFDEDKYAKAFQSSPYAISITRLSDGRIIEVNDGFARILGYNAKDIIGKTSMELQIWTTKEDRENVVKDLLSGRRVFSREIMLRNKNEDIRNALLYAERIVINNEECVLSSFNDITEQKQIREVQHRIDKLESVGILAGGIAHDFNNILTSVLGNISLAKLETAEGSNARGMLENAEKSVFRAHRLTRQLITFARGGTPVKNITDIKELIEDTADIVLKENGIECVLDIAGELKNAEVDPGQVGQALTDLLINARQSMPSGGKVEIKAQNMKLTADNSPNKTAVLPEGEYVQIKIIDQGVGIAPQNLDKIFDPYFTTKPDGSGLGLAAVHSIISKHQGLVTVESEIGKGSVFTIYLPVGSGKK
jgi:PAS domain S-box-containing protein